MIEIATLFLSLVVGPQRVELDVSPDIAAVEVRLDGEPVDHLDCPPWRTTVDLGPALLAHRLEAVAFDANGRELDRSVRLLNLGHERHGGGMLLLEDRSGRPEAVSLRWESIGQRAPVQIEVSFDGEPVDFETPERIPLPDYELANFHFVSAVFHFHDGNSRRMEMGFGGRLGLEVSSDLTSVAIEPTADSKPPKLDRLESAFRLRGKDRPLTVHGLERHGAEIILVRDDGVQPLLSEIVRRIANQAQPGGWERRASRRRLDESSTDRLLRSEKLQRFAKMPRDTRFRVLAPKAALLQPVGVSPEMFLISDAIDGGRRGLLSSAVELPPQSRDTQLGSAVALAGLMAQSSHRPRAVVLMLGEGQNEVGDISPEVARGFLRDLGVPLHVWAFEPLPPNSGWGDIQSLGSQDDIGEAKQRFGRLANDLARQLRRQRLVWLEGRYLPREIELVPDVEDVRLVGRSDADAALWGTHLDVESPQHQGSVDPPNVDATGLDPQSCD